MDLTLCQNLVVEKPVVLAFDTKVIEMKKLEKIRLHIVASITSFLMMSACSDSTISAGIRGYNHMNGLFIEGFTVNGAMGLNVAPESGGGEACCVSLPTRWRPGLKAKVSWKYDQRNDATSPLPDGQTALVDIPPYTNGGSLHVHFYARHKVKIVVSPCSPEHPFYPMSMADLAPWKPFATKEDMRETAQRGGGNVGC